MRLKDRLPVPAGQRARRALLAPLLGIGLILVAAGNRASPTLTRSSRLVLVGLGMTQLFAFLWTLAVRPDVLDRIDGYRIYGAVANVLFGVRWIAFGTSLVVRDRSIGAADPVFEQHP